MIRTITRAAVLLVALAAGSASAQERALRREATGRPWPLTVQVGAGVANFTEGGTQTVTDPGVMWTARAVLGLSRVLAAELGYLGSAGAAQLPGIADASVLHNAAELLARAGWRFNLSPSAYVSPYVTAGLGVGSYNVVGEESGVPGLRDNDGVVMVPFGLGVAGGYQRFGLDLRFMYRPTFADGLFGEVYDGIFSDGLNTLSFAAAVGYSF